MMALEVDTMTGLMPEEDDNYDNMLKTQVYLHYDFSQRDEQHTKLPVFNERKQVSVIPTVFQ